MADTVEMQDIRGMDIDKLAKGFADQEFIFKSACQVSTMTGDSIRWYRKTSGTLSATSPSTLETAPLATPTTIEQSWTRYTSYPKKYMVEGFISEEDIKSADLDVLATSVRDLTRAIVSRVDTEIYNIMTEYSSATGLPAPSAIQTFATTAVGGDQWDATSGQDPIKDILNAQRLLFAANYNAMEAVLYLNEYDYMSLVTWLISSKGSSIPGFSSEKVRSGVITEIVGTRIVVTTNATVDYGLMVIPQRACTFKQYTPTRATVIQDPMIGSKIRVSEAGVAYLTDPEAVVLITDLKT